MNISQIEVILRELKKQIPESVLNRIKKVHISQVVEQKKPVMVTPDPNITAILEKTPRQRVRINIRLLIDLEI